MNSHRMRAMGISLLAVSLGLAIVELVTTERLSPALAIALVAAFAMSLPLILSLRGAAPLGRAPRATEARARKAGPLRLVVR